jgi:hypothetical protein
MAEKNKIYYGDNLAVLRAYIPPNSVDLVYLESPFNSRQAYALNFQESRRIMRTAPTFGGTCLSSCGQHAVVAQNPRRAPYWYHCEQHAVVYRQTGRVYQSI